MDLNKSFKIYAYGLDIDQLVDALYNQGVPNVGIDVDPDRTGFWMVLFNPTFQQLQVVDIIFDIIERDYQANISELITTPQEPTSFNRIYDFPMPQTQGIIDYVPYATTPIQARQDLGLNPMSPPSQKSYQLPGYINSPQGEALGLSPRLNASYSEIPSQPVLGQIRPPSNIEFFVPSI